MRAKAENEHLVTAKTPLTAHIPKRGNHFGETDCYPGNISPRLALKNTGHTLGWQSGEIACQSGTLVCRGGKKFISGTLVCLTTFVKQKLPLRAVAKKIKRSSP
jgi:hypothetical protein